MLPSGGAANYLRYGRERARNAHRPPSQTGQVFTEDALELIWERTAGQPWLVNALCYDACFRHKPGRDRAGPVTAGAIVAAQERLILRRDTHIDDLANKLRGERVRRVIEPILAGAYQRRVTA